LVKVKGKQHKRSLGTGDPPWAKRKLLLRSILRRSNGKLVACHRTSMVLNRFDQIVCACGLGDVK
jgi:hypothetical protein